MTVTVLSLMAENAYSGLQGGNTQIFRPVNEKGERIEVSLGVSHPEQAELKKRIENSGLPDRLRWEMATDLEKTLVYTTNEILKYKDVIDQVVWIPQSKTVEKTTGSKKEKETTTYEAVMNCNYSICVEKVNLLLDRKRDFYVSAIYDRNRNEVIYFQKVLDKMTQEERMEVVLHEQGHRLGLLGKQRENERFVTGWSRMMTDYLLGKSNQEDLDQFLKNVGLFEVYHDNGLPGEVQTNLDYFYVPREIEVDASFFESIAINEASTYFYVNYPVDSLDFPTFKKGEFERVYFYDRNLGKTKNFDDLKKIRRAIAQYLKKKPKFKINLRIVYRKKKIRLPNGLEKNNIIFTNIHFVIDPYDKIKSSYASLMEKAFDRNQEYNYYEIDNLFNLNISDIIHFAFEPEKIKLVSSYFKNLENAMMRLKKKDLIIYQMNYSHFDKRKKINLDMNTLTMTPEELDAFLMNYELDATEWTRDDQINNLKDGILRDYEMKTSFGYSDSIYSFFVDWYFLILSQNPAFEFKDYIDKANREFYVPLNNLFKCLFPMEKLDLKFHIQDSPGIRVNFQYSQDEFQVLLSEEIMSTKSNQEVVALVSELLNNKKAFKNYGNLIFSDEYPNGSNVVIKSDKKDEKRKLGLKWKRKRRKILRFFKDQLKSGSCLN